MTSARVLTCLQAGQRELALAAVPSPYSPSQAAQTYQLHSAHATAQDIGQPGPRKGCDMVIHGWPTGRGSDPWPVGGSSDLGQHLQRQHHRCSLNSWQQCKKFKKKLLATKTLQPPVPAETRLGPAHSTPQLCARSGTPTVGEGMWFSVWNVNILDLCECKSLPFLCTSLLWGKLSRSGRRKGRHLKVSSACLSQSSGLPLQQLGSRPHPGQGDRSDGAGSPGSWALALPTQATHPAKMTAASTPAGKTGLASTPDPALPPKAWGKAVYPGSSTRIDNSFI